MSAEIILLEERLSLHAIRQGLMLSLRGERVRLIYRHAGRCLDLAASLCGALVFFRGGAALSSQDIGGIVDETGGSIVERITGDAVEATDLALRDIEKAAFFKRAGAIVPPAKLLTHYSRQLYREFLSAARMFHFARRHILAGDDGARVVILCRDAGIGDYLERFFQDDRIRFQLHGGGCLAAAAKGRLKGLARALKLLLLRCLIKRPPDPSDAKIAVHVAFGLDERGESDLFWYRKGLVGKDRVLMYFDDCDSRGLCPDTLCRLDAMGFDWVYVPSSYRIWDLKTWGRLWAPARPERLQGREGIFSGSETGLAPALMRRLRLWTGDLIREVEFWLPFFREFRIKVHFESDLFITDLSKCIALNLAGGVQLGKQRSDFKLNSMPVIRDTCHNVFFAWNERIADKAPGFTAVDAFIVAGSAYALRDGGGKAPADELRGHGARFVVAAFDNVFNKDIHFTWDMVRRFYDGLLRMAEEDAEIGLLFKSKKAAGLERMEDIRRRIGSLEREGRCIFLRGGPGLLCSNCSMGADLVVGLGISSAVIECVIAGSRGLHCDLPRFRNHEYYRWGHGRLVYDDIEEMIRAIQQHKQAGSEGEGGLGDWAEHLPRIDAFRDGAAGERIESYAARLLEELSGSDDYKRAIECANEAYALAHGRDKVVLGGRSVLGSENQYRR